MELVRHSAVREGAQIGTYPRALRCFDLFCLRIHPRYALGIVINLVSLPAFSLSLSLSSLSPSLGVYVASPLFSLTMPLAPSLFLIDIVRCDANRVYPEREVPRIMDIAF